MKSILINPSIPEHYPGSDLYIPSGLLSISTILQKHEVEVRLIDLNTVCRDDHETLLDNEINNFKPDFIGVGCLFSVQFVEVVKLAEYIKNNHSIPIIIGGSHPTRHYNKILSNCVCFDWIVVGEGELTIAEFVEVFKSGKNDFHNIDGLAYRDKDGIHYNADRNLIVDLDDIPLPSYEVDELYDFRKRVNELISSIIKLRNDKRTSGYIYKKNIYAPR